MRCRSPYCANNPLSRIHLGELCDDCEARARRKDEAAAELEAENPTCRVCSERKDDHEVAVLCVEVAETEEKVAA